MRLDNTKVTPVGDIPTGILKYAIDIQTSILPKLSFRNGSLPGDLKAAQISIIFKKNDDFDMENYRPATVLRHMSKTFQRSRIFKL